MSRLRYAVPGAVLVASLSAWFWAPALFRGRTIVHGDSIVNGLPFVDLLARALRGKADLLWSDAINGGHPLFAEGQGGFASPLNLVVAGIVVPIFGSITGTNVFHFLAMVLSGIGVLGLCRELGASAWAAALGALAVVFSPAWIYAQDNLPISGTLAFAPWGLWAMEAWLKRPTLMSATCLGAACALMILGGYPQGLHAAVLYMSASLCTVPFQAALRGRLTSDWRRYAATGLAAILFCVGAAAIQWLPQWELAGLSYRGGGVELVPSLGATPASAYYLALLFTPPPLLLPLGPVASLGSLFICALASAALLFRTRARLKGHALATLLLLQLGMSKASPIFDFVRQYHLIPGLGFFRITHIYLTFVVIGLSVLASAGVDALAQAMAADSKEAGDTKTLRRRILGGLALAISWIVLLAAIAYSDARPAQYVVPAVALLGAAMLFRFRRGELLPVFLVGLLVCEIAALRVHSFRFFNPAVLGLPRSVAAVKAQRGFDRFKVFGEPTYLVVAFARPRRPDLGVLIQEFLASMGTLGNVMWDLPSINGALGLPLRRRIEVEPIIEDEIAGRATTAPGLRLIDILGVRFLSFPGLDAPARFSPLWHEPHNGPWIAENAAALPRFQIYARHVQVASPEAALRVLANAKEAVLAVEGDGSASGSAEPDVNGSPQAAGSAGRIEVLKARATFTRLAVAVDRPAWLFMADANFPGWTASIDGKEAPVFTAQVLGKAIRIPEGEHIVTFAFRPRSFYVGLAVSLASLALMISALAMSAFRRSPR